MPVPMMQVGIMWMLMDEVRVIVRLAGRIVAMGKPVRISRIKANRSGPDKLAV